MEREHVISDEVFAQAKIELQDGNHWIAYNELNYFIDKGDAYFFKDEDSAGEFAINNISDVDSYIIIHCQSVDELLKKIPYGEQLQKLLIFKNLSIMNEKNFDYLKTNVRNHGFGETLGPELEAQLKKGNVEFTLVHKTEVNKREMEANLYFKKSDTTDMYFFNKYDTRMKNEKDETVAQTFYINKGWGVTLKEAYNLLNGRAVHKELTDKQDQKYQAWIQLDFGAKDKQGNFERKQYHENYGYDLKEALSFYFIKEMIKEDDMKSLLKSLERGNCQMITVQAPGGDVKVFIEANPQYKSINVYDNKMNRLGQEQREGLMQKPEIKEQKQEQGKDKDQKQDKSEMKSLLQKKNKGNGLLEKKRTSSKKGLGIR